jgi:hypothetical protein
VQSQREGDTPQSKHGREHHYQQRPATDQRSASTTR